MRSSQEIVGSCYTAHKPLHHHTQQHGCMMAEKIIATGGVGASHQLLLATGPIFGTMFFRYSDYVQNKLVLRLVYRLLNTKTNTKTNQKKQIFLLFE
jgi:hypothetical protein